MALEELENRASFLEQRTKLNEVIKKANQIFGYYVTDVVYGGIGDYDETTGLGTDNTAAINAMMDDVRAQIFSSSVISKVKERCLVRITFPRGRYLCLGSLNFTGIRAYGWIVNFEGAEIVSKAEGKTAIDIRGSRYGRFNNLLVYGHEAARPSVGVAIGRDSTGATCDLMYFDYMTMLGEFTLTGLYNCASETCTFVATHIHNRLGGDSNYCVIQDGKTDFNVPSDFITPAVVGTAYSFNENTFISPDIRKGFSGPSMYFGRTTGHKIVGGYTVTGDGPAIVVNSDAYGNIGLDLDIHCESSSLTPGIQNAIRFQGIASQKHIGFKFTEHGNHAQDSVIAIDTAGTHGGAITNIEFIGSNISILGEIATPTNGVFSDPSVVTYSGNISYLSDNEPTGLNVSRMTGSIVARTTGFTKPIDGTYTTTATDTGAVTHFPSGSYTPTIDFETSGDLSVAYTNQTGYFTVNGNTCHVSIRLIFTPTYTTATGDVKVSLPIMPRGDVNTFSSLDVSSDSANLVYPAGYTSIDGYITRLDDFATIRANGSGQNSYDLTTTDIPSGSQQVWTITGSYLID